MMKVDFNEINDSIVESISILTFDLYDDLLFYTKRGLFVLSPEDIKNCFIYEYPKRENGIIRSLKKIKDHSFSKISEEGLFLHHRDIIWNIQIEDEGKLYDVLARWKSVDLNLSIGNFSFHFEPAVKKMNFFAF